MFKKTPQVRVLFNCWRRQAQFVMLGVFLFATIAASVATVMRPQTSSALSNNNLNFQARLQTASGAVVPDGEYNIQFKLYDAASSGSLLWSESWYDSNGATAGNDNRLLVKNGYFSVSLGDQNAFPTTINWNQQLWLTMRVGGSAQTSSPSYDSEMDPRLKLTGVPYAFRAGELAKYNSTTGYTGLLQFQNTTGGNQTFVVPDQGAAGTYTLMTEESLAGAAIQNGTSVQSNANIAIQSASDSSVTALLKSRSSQSADILRLVDSNDALIFNINAYGQLHQANAATFDSYVGVGTSASSGEQLRVAVADAATTALSLYANGAQTADIIKVDGVGTRALNYSSNGTLYLTAGSGQSSALISMEDSGSNVVARFTATGSLQTSALDTVTAGTLTIGASNATAITLSQNTTVSGTVDATGGYKNNGVSGANTTCSGGQFLQNSVVAGGITTSGTCATPTDTGMTAIGTIDSQTKSANGAVASGATLYLQTADASNPGIVSTGTQTFAGAKTFSGVVTASNASNVLGGDGSALTALNASNLASGTVANGRLSGSYTGVTGTGALAAGSIATGFGNITTANTVTGSIVNATTKFQANGTDGATTTCSGGQLLQNAVIAGGIITGGSCVAGSGVATVGTIDSQTKSANGAVIAGTSIYMQTADASNPGIVSTGTQTFAGAKTFSGAFAQSGSSFSLTGSSATSSLTTTNNALNITGGAFSTWQTTSGGLTITAAGTSETLTLGTGTTGTVTVGTSSTTTINLGNTNNARTISIGSAASSNTLTLNLGSVGSSSSTVIQGGTGASAITLTTGSGGSISLTATGTGDITIRGDQTLFKPTADTATAFQVQQAGGGTSVFNVDTTNKLVGINKNSPSYALDVSGSINVSLLNSYKINGTDVCTGSGCTAASGSSNYIQNNTTMFSGQAANLYITSASSTLATSRFQQKFGGTGDILQVANGVGAINFSVDYHGASFFKPTDVGTATFQVQDNGGVNMFTVDSTNSRVYIGNSTADSTGTVLVLDTKNTSGDPTGVAGAMYYNSNSGRFRCYEGSSWKNCLSRNDYTPAFIGYNQDTNSAVGVGSVASSTGTANYANLVSVTVPVPTTVSGIRISLGTYSGTAGNVDVGLYDNSGARLASSGSVAAPATDTVSTINFTSSAAIEPGIYWLAIASNQVGKQDGTGGPIFKRYALDGVGGNLSFASSFPLPSSVTLGSPSGAGIPFALMGIVSGGVTQ